jgi:hypothetical protein
MGARGGVGHGELGGPLTRAREAVRCLGDGGDGGGGRNFGAERAPRPFIGSEGEWGNGGGDECGEEGQAPRPFIGSEGERGGRAAAVVRHNRMKAAVSEGNRSAWW